MSQENFKPGLEGVIAGDTEVACVDQGVLLYRGYAIEDLAEHATFEEVAHLLLYGELPDQIQLDVLKAVVEEAHTLSKPVVDALRLIPHDVPMMDVLRSMVSFAGHYDPVKGDSTPAMYQRALWLIGQTAAIISARYRLINGKEPIETMCGLSHAAQILYQAHGVVPDALSAHLLDLTLVLYAEHEFNASTFTCRVICSTMSDMVSGVTGAIGALKGPLHGGANEAAMEMLKQFKTADEAKAWIANALATKQKVMGFGHRVYKHGDHRARILERELRKLAESKGEQRWMDIYDAIKDPMVNEKNIMPNVDYPCGLTYFLLGLPLDLYTPLFVASRVTGWCAHFIEQAMNNRIYRPLSRYTGPALRPVKPLAERG
ncbi:MAG: bifunctional 2-methylcitrate synthase/citrate synthase [Candidatus Hydrogenedentes bacterium]|nr:bifunctional 2-methylcitrate synthase/citrate synthase [Candidatus Hydrogenedentota bacterium]